MNDGVNRLALEDQPEHLTPSEFTNANSLGYYKHSTPPEFGDGPDRNLVWLRQGQPEEAFESYHLATALS